MIYRNLLLLYLITFSTIVLGQPVYDVKSEYPVHDLKDKFLILIDSNTALTPKQVLSDSTLEFVNRSSFPHYLDSNTTYWAKFRLRTSDSLTGWSLHMENRNLKVPAWGLSIGKADVYAYTDKQLLFHRKAGVDYPKEERDKLDQSLLNRISLDGLPKDQLVTFVIRAKGNALGYPAFFQLSIRDPDHQYYHPLYEFNNSFNMFMFGVTFIIFVYHLLQFIYLRQSVFFWFSVWLLFCMLIQAMIVGLFLGEITSYKFPLWMVISNGIFYTFWFFGRSFINSKQKYPLLDKFILTLAILICLEVFGTVLYVILFDVDPVFLRVGIHDKLAIGYATFSLVIAIILTLKKDLFARYFGFGAIIISLAFIVGGLWVEGVIVPPINPYAWGIFLKIIIYSFGIAYRQQHLTQQAYEEKLVAERSVAEMQRIQEVNEIKSRFFANISHEFRTPLTLISGPLSEAGKKSRAPGHEEDEISLSSKEYNVIKKNAFQLQTLVDQLLNLSKIEHGKVSLTLIQGGMIKFLRSIVYSFESIAAKKNIQLNAHFPEEIPTAYYDQDKLEKITTNVLSNAFKYTPEGGTVTVNVSIDENLLSLEVTDTGTGIEKEDIKRIFERFYRAEGSEIRGSGIGLALTKELVDLHQGRIEVRSAKGVGTSFTISLPTTLQCLPKSISVDITDEYVEESTTADVAPPIRETVTGSSSKVHAADQEIPVALIVEDNEDLREYITSILERKYRIVTASNGLQGERIALEHIPDLIITDVMMPKKDGYELCHALKKNTKTSHIPIIMLTAKAGQTNKMEGLTQGADAYLVKPFDADELLLRARNLIEARRRVWEHFRNMDMLLVNDLNVSSVEDEFLQQVMATIKENLDDENFSVEDIARAVGFSRSQLHRKLKALTSRSAQQLVAEIRLNEAHRLLANKAGTVSEIAYSVGYTNMSYFTKTFKEKFGLLPSKI